MKYHYQFVSNTTVRIELIAEDQKETALLKALQAVEKDDQQLKDLFKAGLSNYAPNSEIKKLNFMSFPKVALCTYEKAAIIKESTAL